MSTASAEDSPLRTISAINVSQQVEISCENRYHTSMGFRHGCRDSSAHGHDGEGKEGEDVLGVHFGKKES